MSTAFRPEDTDDVLATAGLYSESVLLGADEMVAADQEASVTLVRPLVYRLNGTAEPGPVDLLLCFPFGLEELTGGRAYAQVRLSVVFDDEEARALTLQPAEGTLHEDGTRVSAFGRGDHRLRWVFDAPPSGLRPDGHWTQVLLRLPADRTAITGRIRVDVTVRRTLLGRMVGKRARTEDGVPFRVAVADAWPAVAPAPVLPYPLTAPPEGAQAHRTVQDTHDTHDTQPTTAGQWLRRLLLAVDVEHYSRRNNTQMGRIQRDLWRAVRGACTASGIDWQRCGRQASGDGYLLVLPVGLDEPGTIVRLLRGLTLTLHTANTDPARPGDIRPTRMRASLHQGPIAEGHSGFLGKAVVDLFRMLDSSPLREALRDSADADLAVAWSDALYRDLVPHAYPGLDPSRFRRVKVVIPEKEHVSEAWIELRPRPVTGPVPKNGTVGVAPNPH